MTYVMTPCNGSCPLYAVTVKANGIGMFTGTSNTAVVGRRRFLATREQVAEFLRRLQPYLPAGELLLSGPNACRTYATDLPSVDVTWTDESGAGHLRFDYGCDRGEHHMLAEALRAAPQALPIAGLIGKR
jgi:hypothetical protein